MKNQLSNNDKKRQQKTFTVKRVFSVNKYKVKVIKTLKSIIFVSCLMDGTNKKRTKIKRDDKYELTNVLLSNLINAKDSELIKEFILRQY